MNRHSGRDVGNARNNRLDLLATIHRHQIWNAADRRVVRTSVRNYIRQLGSTFGALVHRFWSQGRRQNPFLNLTTVSAGVHTNGVTRSSLAESDLSWAVPTGHPASDQRIEAAAKAAWPFAVLCAWTYLNDHAAAHDIMDHAVENTSAYISRHPDSSDEKLLAHAKSAVKRRAQQLATKKNREVSYWSLPDLESLYIMADAI